MDQETHGLDLVMVFVSRIHLFVLSGKRKKMAMVERIKIVLLCPTLSFNSY